MCSVCGAKMVSVGSATPEIQGVDHSPVQTLSAHTSPCRRTMRLGMWDGGLGACMRCKDGVVRIGHTGDTRCRPFPCSDPFGTHFPRPQDNETRHVGWGPWCLYAVQGWCRSDRPHRRYKVSTIPLFRPFRHTLPPAAGQ